MSGGSTTLSVRNSVIDRNEAKYGGAGIFCQYGTCTVLKSIIRNNQVLTQTNYYGGAAFWVKYSGKLILVDSIVSNNSAHDENGDVFFTSHGNEPHIPTIYAINSIIHANVDTMVAGYAMGSAPSCNGTLNYCASIMLRRSHPVHRQRVHQSNLH